MIDILFIVPPLSLLLDIAGPAEAFRLGNQHLAKRGDKARFNIRFAGPKSQCESSVGLQLAGIEPLPTSLSDRVRGSGPPLHLRSAPHARFLHPGSSPLGNDYSVRDCG